MKLTAERIKEASYVRNIFAVTPEHSTEFEEVLQPSFWAHVAAKLHPTDRIEVTSEDGTWFAELFVVSCGRNWAKVSVLRFHELTEDKADTKQVIDDIETEFYSVWRGQTHQHCVMRKKDKEVIKTNFQTKADADKWIAQHVMTLTASS